MKIAQCEQVPSTPVRMEGAQGCGIRCLIGPEDNAPSFSMRHFEIEPGGYTPRHTHAHEHEVFVLAGEGSVMEGDTEHPLRPGMAVFVPPGQTHQFRNQGPGPFKFLCLIPHPLRGMTDACTAACGCE